MQKTIKAYIIYCLVVIITMSISYITSIFHFSATTFIIGFFIGIWLNNFMEEE